MAFYDLANLLSEYIMPNEQCCLMSIKPIFVNRMLEGIKIYEYRRVRFRTLPHKIFIYSTSPEKSIIGFFTPEIFYCDTPAEIWQRTYIHSGLSKQEYDLYTNNAQLVTAIKVRKIIQFDKPINPYMTAFKPPQSFYYL
ncbi:hypothetical protein [Desulfosporosinus lacus]|uniref:Predicted transcriptional regulator, contains an HTH and PUA-like domains n=1 Tax=Desulfosporosinus lacus DSM 15449 TaxID=1121420 RepID=A0A1M5S8Z3_9FIRM|nr:hypothetical protein [Desulfosporosinus lacus]SHH34941.1 Predicted transcriptional regulator, contains an HTH and PUA-like domains [Desulfosporosinus lacus DSM 15449]